jgi:hypothetical protein
MNLLTTYLLIGGYTNIPQPTPLKDRPKARVLFSSKYSLTTDTAGIKVMPMPKPTIPENDKNRYSTEVAKELRANPAEANKDPHIMIFLLPYLNSTTLPNNPEI